MLSTLVVLTAIATSPLSGPTQLPFTAEEASASVGDMVAAEAQAKAGAPQVLPVSDEELGFFDQYYPFTLSDNLHPEIEDNMVVIWIISALVWEFAGALWIPKVLVGLDTDEEFTSDALIGWLIHAAPLILSVLGPLAIVGTIYWIVASFYLSPVHIINTYNRHIVGSKKKSRKAREKKGNAAFNALPGLPAYAANGAAAAF